MVFKSLISIFLALLLGIVLIINTENMLVDSESKTTQSLVKIESEIYDLKISEYEPKNTSSIWNANQKESQKKYDMLGSKATQFSNGVSLIENVDLKVYQYSDSDENETWHIVANLANHNQSLSQTHLTGGVRVVNESQKIKLETESLWVLHNQKIIHSNEFVHYSMPNQNIYSSGVEINYSHKIVEFHNGVQNLIDQNQ